MAAKKKTFEESLNRLEEIVAEMEAGELSLEKMMAHFEEGSTLVKDCGSKLEEVESKIEQLVKKGDELATEPMNTDESGG
jgi:exodeoxyribonuclease VII small subunit